MEKKIFFNDFLVKKNKCDLRINYFIVEKIKSHKL
jgi:hypothetical protein